LSNVAAPVAIPFEKMTPEGIAGAPLSEKPGFTRRAKGRCAAANATADGVALDRGTGSA
jgi:hypothetical protein